MPLHSTLASAISEVRGSKSLRVTHTSGVSLERARHILVLDSSFNPPTIAHRSLALAGYYLHNDVSAESDAVADEEVSHNQEASPPDSILLLLSITNADKAPKAGDASPEQRLEMMQRLAEALYHAHPPTSSASRVTRIQPQSVAVAAIDAPTFIEKANVLRGTFASSPDGPPQRHTFVLGTDTLIRVLDPKYYGGTSFGRDTALSTFFGSEGLTSILCADRPDLLASSDANLSSAVEEYVRRGQVRFVQLPENTHRVSSSAVRQAIAAKSDNRANDWGLMVDPAIAEFVEKNGLYRHETNNGVMI